MKNLTTIFKLLLFPLLFILFNTSLNATDYNTNLVQNGTAESGIGSWSIESGSGFTRANYSTGWAGTAPSDAGSYFFYGGSTSAVTVYQTIDISDISVDIDAGDVSFTLSGYHGGYANRDTIDIQAIFLDSTNSEISSSSTGAYTSSGQMDPFNINGAVPWGTKSIQMKMIFVRNSGTDNDGYADNVSITLEKSAPPRVCTGSDGLLGEYYNDSPRYNSFVDPVILSRVDSNINFTWGDGGPGNGVSDDEFSAEWTGTIYIPENADYTFQLAHDDRMTLDINGTTLYTGTSWTRGENNFEDATTTYFAAGNYPITIRFAEGGGGAYARLAWTNNVSISNETIVPSTNLCTTSSTTSADLALSETTVPSPSSANTNEDIDFFVHAENLGPDTSVADITISFTYSLDVEIISVPTGLSCSVTSGMLSQGSVNTCTIGSDVASGTTADLQMTVQAEEGGTLTQTATVSSTTYDPVGGNNSVTSSPVDITLVVVLNAADNEYTVNSGSTLTGNVITDNDTTHGTDTGTPTLTATHSDTTTQGTLTFNSDGSFTYEAPSTGYTGTQTFTYTITSSATGGSSQATVTIDVLLSTDYDTNLDFELINPENTRNVIGNYAIAGNTVLCLTDLTTGYATSESQCVDSQTNGSNGVRTSNNYVSKYIDIDNDSSTWNSSSSNINLDPTIYAQNGGDGILWAGLIWQGRFAWHVNNNNGTEDLRYYTENGSSPTVHNTGQGTGVTSVSLTDANVKNIRLDIDGNGYEQITAFKVHSLNSDGGITYTSIANVTNNLRNANLAPGDHTFTVANLPTEEGREDSPGVYGGWSLVVIYAEDTFNGSPRNISIYGGMDRLLGSTNTNNNPIEITGFKLPSSGDSVTAQLSIFSGEGELAYQPDGVQISDNENSGYVNMPTTSSQTNIFDAVMFGIDRDNVTGHMNNLQNNNVGVDVDSFDLSAIVSGYSRDITSMYLKWYSDQDYIIPGMIAFSTELYRPSLCYDYTLDVNGYVIPSTDNLINTGLGAYTSFPLTTRVSIRSEEGDFVLQDVNISYAIADTNQTTYISGTTAIAPDNIYRYDPVPAGQVYDETLSGFGLYIGEGAGIGYGGSIDSYETRYFRFENDLVTSNVDTYFTLTIQYTVDFGSGPVPQAAIFDAQDICAQDYGYFPATGRYNVASVDATPASTDTTLHGAPYNLYTQVADREATFEVYSYDPDNSSLRKESNTTIEVEIFNAGLFTRDINLTCNNPDSNLTEPVFVPFYEQTWTTISGSYNVAMRNVGFRTWHLTAPDGGAADHHCTDKDDETCFQTLYNNIYSTDGNCTSQCTSVANGGTASGCYPCLKEYYGNPICSRDNFSIRPDAFVVKLIDSNQSQDTTFTPTPITLAHSKNPADGGLTNTSDLVAGYRYRYDVNATSFISDSAVPKYIRVFNETSVSTSTALMNWSPRTSATDCNSPDPIPISTVLFDGTSIYNNTAIVGQLDQVGEYKLEISDQNWTSADWDDSLLAHHVAPGFSVSTEDDCIFDSNLTEAESSNGIQGCMITNNNHEHPAGRTYETLDLRFYPYEFSLNLSLGAGPTNNRDFVYINTMLPNTSEYPNSVDENMSYNIQGTFTALGFGGIAVNNFVTNCYAEDVNMTLLHTYLDTTLPLPSSETALRYNLVDYNTSLDEVRPRENGILSNLSTSETALSIIQGEQYFTKDMQGSINMDLGFNFNRTNNNVPALNPRRINFGDFNITDALGTNVNVEMRSDHLITGGLATPNDNNVTFMYARAKPAQEFYDDVMTLSIITPISVVAYCDGTLSECINLGIPFDGVSDIQTNEALWLKSIYHDNVSNSDGNIGITESTANVSLSSNVVAINSGGENTSITVTRTPTAPLPLTVPIELITAPTTNYTDRWLIYNEDSATDVPSPFYRVRFIGEEGWAGHGQTGHVVDGNVSSKKNQRLGW